MKRVITNGITCLEPLPGSSEWYWGMDYTGGDLYEAGNLYRDGHPVQCNRFCILWPERREFVLEDRESFILLDGDRIYMEKWYEDPAYRDKVLVGDFRTGKVLKRMPGSIWPMPDGRNWLLV